MVETWRVRLWIKSSQMAKYRAPEVLTRIERNDMATFLRTSPPSSTKDF
jgi:hypothetical protein